MAGPNCKSPDDNEQKIGVNKSLNYALNKMKQRLLLELSETDGKLSTYDGPIDLKDITMPILTKQHTNKVNSKGKGLLKLQKTSLKETKIDHDFLSSS